MSSGLKILQFYQSSSELPCWGVELGNNLNDSFFQLNAIIPEFIYHDVINDSISQTLSQPDEIDFVIVSINSKDLEGEIFLSQLAQLLELIPLKNIFKVLIAPVDQKLLPNSLKRHIGYSCYDVFTGEKLGQKKYWHKLVDLTYDIVLLDKEEAIKGYVFLAETIEKFKSAREQVKRELLRQGYVVLPKESYELEEEQPRETIYQLLEKSILGVHIIGSGDADNISERNISDKQNEISSDYCLTHPNFKRIVWVAEDSDELIEDEYLYIEQLKRDKQVLHGAEIVQIPLEKLKNFVISRLQNYQEETEIINPGMGDKKLVYLISDQEDRTKCIEIKQWLEEQNMFVIQTDFSVEQITIFREHRKNLARCDAIIIFHSRNNFKWVKMKLLDLKKAPGYGRISPLLGMGLSLENDQIAGKLSNIDTNVLLLSSGSKMNQKSVNFFCEKIEKHA
jgi:hypothetical protein